MSMFRFGGSSLVFNDSLCVVIREIREWGSRCFLPLRDCRNRLTPSWARNRKSGSTGNSGSTRKSGTKASTGNREPRHLPRNRDPRLQPGNRDLPGTEIGTYPGTPYRKSGENPVKRGALGKINSKGVFETNEDLSILSRLAEQPVESNNDASRVARDEKIFCRNGHMEVYFINTIRNSKCRDEKIFCRNGHMEVYFINTIRNSKFLRAALPFRIVPASSVYRWFRSNSEYLVESSCDMRLKTTKQPSLCVFIMNNPKII
ncbi:hypothetical protein L6452_22731 [Arctium lappa]|uniref:Uncharacterized protein n=1 Tax=Arctium lappa TaxID=4217 RepID=A0ACB9B072_ARCLA|nr:hypothetical protein L6452_22731 [Arctium lappa]